MAHGGTADCAAVLPASLLQADTAAAAAAHAIMVCHAMALTQQRLTL